MYILYLLPPRRSNHMTDLEKAIYKSLKNLMRYNPQAFSNLVTYVRSGVLSVPKSDIDYSAFWDHKAADKAGVFNPVVVSFIKRRVKGHAARLDIYTGPFLTKAEKAQ